MPNYPIQYQYSPSQKVHFIRHAEGTHNVASREAGTDNILINNEKFWDAPLTEEGIEQCKRLRRELAVRPSQGKSVSRLFRADVGGPVVQY